MPTEEKLRELIDKNLSPKLEMCGDKNSLGKWTYAVYSYNDGSTFEVIFDKVHMIPMADYQRLGKELRCMPEYEYGEDQFKEGEFSNTTSFPTKAIYTAAEIDGEYFALYIRGARGFKPRGSHHEIKIPEHVKQDFVVLAQKNHPYNFPKRNVELHELIEQWKLDEYEKRRSSE